MNTSLASSRPRAVSLARSALISTQALAATPRERWRDARVGSEDGLDTGVQPQPEDGRFGRRHSRGRRARRPLVAVGPPQGRHVAIQACRVPAAHRGPIRRMRARTDGQEWAASPIQQVVPALVAGTSQVGELVALQARHVRQGRRSASSICRGRSCDCSTRARWRHRRAPALTGRWSPSARSDPRRPDRPARARTPTGGRAPVPGPLQACVSIVAPIWPGMSVSRSRLTERHAGVACDTHGLDHVGRGVAAAKATQLRPRPSTARRSTDASHPPCRRPARSPSSSGPGFASSVISAFVPMPKRASMRSSR